MSDNSITQNQQILHRFTEAILNDDVKESLRLIEDLKFFLATAPANWQKNQVIRRYYLSADEGFVSCVYWNNLYFITGTDIVRCIVYKFQQFGRKIIDRKKFEEGIFSDLRNLKCGTDAILEPPKSKFLDFLYKNNCLRTQKKQKVFFWFNVPHDKLMADALERDLKKEKVGQSPTTIADREPALSFQYEEEKMLYNQLLDYNRRNALDESTDENPDTTTSSSNLTEDDPKSTKSKASDSKSSQKKHKLDDEVSPETSKKAHTLKLDTKTQPPEGFDFLTQETPDKYKQNSDDEDDFPLDYFQDNQDYILIDSSTSYPAMQNYAEGMEMPESAPLFPYPVASQVVVNDEYLIEQTMPIKTPLPLPRSGKLDEFYQFAPLSSKLSSFPLPPYFNQYSNQFPQFGQYPPPSAGVQANFPQQPGSASQPSQQSSSQGASTSSSNTVAGSGTNASTSGSAVSTQHLAVPPSAQHVHFFPHQLYPQDPYSAHEEGFNYPEQYQHNPYMMMPEHESMYYGHMYPYPYLPPPGSSQGTGNPGPSSGQASSAAPSNVTATGSNQGNQTVGPSPAYGHFPQFQGHPHSPYALSFPGSRQNIPGQMIKRTMLKPLSQIKKPNSKKDESS